MNENEKKLFKFVHKISCELNDVDYIFSLTNTRKRECVVTRQMTMAAYRHYTKMSLAGIGAMFNKDHATVLHAVKTINNLCDTQIGFSEKYKLLLNKTYNAFKRISIKKDKSNNIGNEIKAAMMDESMMHIKINVRGIIEKYGL